MVNVPLIQGNSIQEINTSIIAIKKAQKELETLNTLVDNKIKALNLALSGGSGKYIESISQIQGLIEVTEGSITDTVASGNYSPITSNAVSNILCFTTSGRSLTGATLQIGIIIRVMFTTQQTGSNASTAFTIIYNGTAYTVKASKNGSLSNFVANNINGSYIYCQAYTTLELLYDGSQFIIMGNPVVISSADYTIYTDGSLVYKDSAFKRLSLTPNIFAGGNVYYNKSGNYVNLFFNRLVTNNKIAVDGYVTVGTLPEGYRPSANLGTAGIICGTNSGNRQKYSVTISNSGEILLFNDYGNIANTLFYGMGMITFPIDF